MTHTFKRGDTGLTRDGRRFEVLADDMGGEQPLLVRSTIDAAKWDSFRAASNPYYLMPLVTDAEFEAFINTPGCLGKIDSRVLRDGLAAAFAVRDGRK